MLLEVQSAVYLLLDCAHEHLFIFFFTVLLINAISIKYQKGLRSVPGPWLAGFSNVWRLAVVWKRDMPASSILLHAKHGSLVRMGPNHVSVADPEALKIIYGSDSRYQKSAFYRTAQARYEGSVLSNMFASPGDDFHARMRRTTGHLYSLTSITELEPVVDSCVQMFVAKLQKSASSGESVHIEDWLQYYSFDCLGALSFSHDIGFLSSGVDVGSMIHAVDVIFEYVALIGQMPFLDKLLLGNPLLSIIKPESQKSGGILNFAIDKVIERQADFSDSNPKDILSRHFEIHKASPEKLSFREIVGAMSINVFAGHDALAIAMRAILYHLCRNPDIYMKLMQEIRQADKAGILSHTSTYSQASNLPYLSAVINEAFRIHPPVGLILERCVPAGGDVISGVHLPGGTIVGINAWVLHRNKSIFGHDVEDFRPERWIDTDTQRLKDMRKMLFTFGSGSRACIGRNIAVFEIYKLILEICRNFDFALANPERQWSFDGSWVTRQRGMDMLFTNKDQSTWVT